MRKLALSSLALLVIPAIALAGKTTTVGTNTLRIEASYKPATASKKNADPRPIGMKFDYFSGTTDGSPNPAFVSVRIETGGPVFNFAAFPFCTYSEATKDGSAACPDGSEVGHGTAVAELYGEGGTTIPLKVDIKAFNADIDIDENDVKRDKVGPGVLVIVEIGEDPVVLPLDAVKGNRGVELRNADAAPPTVTYGIAEIHLKIDRLTIRRSGHRVAFLAAPVRCKGSWIASSTNTPYDGAPIKATDKVKCEKP